MHDNSFQGFIGQIVLLASQDKKYRIDIKICAQPSSSQKLIASHVAVLGTYHVLVYFFGTSPFFGVMLVLFNCHLLAPVLFMLSCASISFCYYKF
jgi:hypothetical protein